MGLDEFHANRVQTSMGGCLGGGSESPQYPLGQIELAKRGRLPADLPTITTAALAAVGFHHVCFNRANLPDIGPFTRFEFPTIGHIYDANDRPLIELAREYRQITKYEDIPPIVRDAILATEDKNFFSHGGVDYSRIPRVLGKVRIGALLAGLIGLGRQDEAIFPQGGSTITQQLVRGHFLQNLTVFQNLTARENSNQLRQGVLLPRVLSCLIGGRSANMVVRKLEEIRLSLWVEIEMQARFGSKRRAKEEILARYASFIYMGNGQYGFARAAEYYFGRPLATFTVEDADKAALLAGIAKSPRDYAPSAKETGRVLRRRNQTLALMVANGFISADREKRAQQCPIPIVPANKGQSVQVAAAVDNVLEELKGLGADLSIKDLLQGRIQVYSTVDARVQQIVNEALEHGLELYEKRHPRAKGLVQGSVVVLGNRDASILAETGGRQFYADRSASYSDYNRVTESLRQPGSAMKPIVYLAAFRRGIFNLESMVPDEPISVPDGGEDKMDLELRWSIQGHDPPPTGTGGIQKRRGDLDHRANWDHQRPADVADSRSPDNIAALRHDRAGRVRSESAGAGQCVPHHRIGHPRPAVCDTEDRPQFEPSGGW